MREAHTVCVQYRKNSQLRYRDISLMKGLVMKMNMKFIEKELNDRDLYLSNPRVKDIADNVFEAMEILTKKEVIEMIDESIETFLSLEDWND